MRQRRSHIFIALFLIAFAFALSAAAQAKKPAASFRSITLVTEPKAIVWIDGIRFGRTNAEGRLDIKTISSGTHTIRVRADGFKEKSQPLTAVQKGEVKVALAATIDEAELAFQEAERLTSEDRQKAAAAYRRAIAARPKYPEAYAALARMLADAGDPEGAYAAIATARRQRPGYAEASAIEGRIHKDAGEGDKAIAAFKRAITEGKGTQPEAFTGLGLYYKEKAEAVGASDLDAEAAAYAEAAKHLRSALKQLSGAPDAMVIYQLLGLIYERQKNYTEAIATYEEFLRIFPDTNEATAVQSFIVQLKKDMAGAQ